MRKLFQLFEMNIRGFLGLLVINLK